MTPPLPPNSAREPTHANRNNGLYRRRPRFGGKTPGTAGTGRGNRLFSSRQGAGRHESPGFRGGVFSKIGFPCGTRLEVKARLTKLVRGGFPAIWQMPMGAPEWPRGGEIDLMEWVQGTPLQIYQTVHTYYINGVNGSAGVTNKNPDKNFDVTKDHVYAVERTEKELIFYVDGKETWRYGNQYLDEGKLQYPFCEYPFNIILNFSLGGELNGRMTWPGEICDEDLPGEMWVDWVRVVSLNNENQSDTGDK